MTTAQTVVTKLVALREGVSFRHGHYLEFGARIDFVVFLATRTTVFCGVVGECGFLMICGLTLVRKGPGRWSF